MAESRKKEPLAAYKKIRPKLKTGDIALFSSKGVFAKAIQWATKSKWSHVGMVINIEGWDLVLLWESNTKQGRRLVKKALVKKEI